MPHARDMLRPFPGLFVHYSSIWFLRSSTSLLRYSRFDGAGALRDKIFSEILLVWIFFFSSGRRHTRSTRDWSSDVCSSDLHNRSMRVAVIAALSAGLLAGACGARRSDPDRFPLDAASRTYVRLVLALGERDSDSLDSYHGPVAWQAEVRAERPTLPQIRAAAATLADSLKTERAAAQEDAPRRAFLIGQLEAVASRVDVLQGARHAFDEEARLLFGLDPHEQ